MRANVLEPSTARLCFFYFTGCGRFGIMFSSSQFLKNLAFGDFFLKFSQRLFYIAVVDINSISSDH